MVRSREQVHDPGVLLNTQVIEGNQVGVWEYQSPIASERPDANKIPMFDCIDQTWTAKMDREAVYQKYLFKVFAKCSGCIFGTAA